MIPDPPPSVAIVKAPTAEPGKSTSEWTVLLATVIHDALIIGITVGLNAAGLHPSDEIKQLIFAEVGGVSTLSAAYIVSRGIRKTGTQG